MSESVLEINSAVGRVTPARPVLGKTVGRLMLCAVALGIPFVVLLVAFEWRFKSSNCSLYGVKQRLLARQAAKTEVLILGASHAYSGIDPSALGHPAFNLAVVSQSIYYDVALARRYLSALPALKQVILPVDYLSLEYELDEGAEPWRAYYYDYFFSIPHRDWHKDLSARNYSAYFLCNEADRARVFFGKSANAFAQYDEWGAWRWELGTNWSRRAELPSAKAEPQYLEQKALVALKRHAAAMRPENLPVNIARLEGLIEELKHAGVSVILVSLPVTHFYRDGMDPAKYARMQKALHDLSAKCDAEYLNYLYDNRFSDEDFSDGDHLSLYGGQKLSRILGAEIASLEGKRRSQASASGNDGK